MTFSKGKYFGNAVGQIWLEKNTILLLNNIGIEDIAKMDDPFEADDMKQWDVDKFLKSKFNNH